MRQWAGVVVAGVLVLVAVGANAGTATAGATGGGCSRSTVEPPGVSIRSLDFGGVSREYRLAVPDHRDPAARLPLLLNFHGSGGLAAPYAAYSQLEEKGPRRGYVVATPEGNGSTVYWNTEDNGGPDDRGFAAVLVDAIENRLCVDPDRVFATGFSNGARFITALACDPVPPFAAIAPVSGINLYDLCPRGRPLGVLTIHGQRDDTVPYAGGVAGYGFRPDFTTPSVPEAARSWAHRDRCAPAPVRTRVSPHVRRASYRHCAAGTAVVLYTVTDGGHAWPGGADTPDRDVATREINAADLVLDFFDHHARR